MSFDFNLGRLGWFIGLEEVGDRIIKKGRLSFKESVHGKDKAGNDKSD